MAAPWTYVKRKLEDGFEEVLEYLARSSIGTGVTFFKGFSGSELSTPRVEIVAGEASPEVLGDFVTGNWLVELQVRVVTNYNDNTRAQHETIAGYIEDVIMRDDIPSQINTTGQVTDFTVFNGAMGWLPGAGEDSVNGENEYMSNYNVTVYCAPTTF